MNLTKTIDIPVAESSTVSEYLWIIAEYFWILAEFYWIWA